MRIISKLLTGIAAAACSIGLAHAEPVVVTFVYSGTGLGGSPYLAQTSTAIAFNEGYFDREFADDPDIRFEFKSVNSSSLVNEGFATGQIAFGSQGDLGAIIARAGGIDPKIIFMQQIRGPIEVATAVDSDIKELKDLEGKKIAVHFAGNSRLIFEKLLSDKGIDVGSMELVNLNNSAAHIALAAKDVDAAVGLNDLIDLQQKGLARIIYSSRNDKPVYGRQSQVSVSREFEAQHPEIVQRVVNALVRASAWSAQEENREALFESWGKSGHSIESFRADFDGYKLRERINPIIDDFVIGRYLDQSADALRLGLIRSDFDKEEWFEPKYVETAIETLGFGDLWEPKDAEGNLITQ